MKTWDVKLISNIIQGGIAGFCHDHPDVAIPRQWWGSISKRISKRLLKEHEMRFGNPVDKLVVKHVAHRVARLIQREIEEAA